MKLDEFLLELKDIMPSEKLMIENGFTEMPNSIRRNYILDEKPNSDHEIPGLIFELFNKYDPQFLRFADFSFYKEIEELDGMFVFGCSSYSLLMFKNLESEVIEKDTEEFTILNYCAKDTTSFLRALIVVFEMYSLRFQGLVDAEDEVANNDFLERATIASGGNRYRRFFKDVIGI